MPDFLRATLGLVGFVGAVIGFREINLNLIWAARRTQLFKDALASAQRRGKPLLVVGRPRDRAHGCGDVCVDLVGCPECPVQYKADVRDLSMFKDGQFGAVFVGHVLESLSSGMEKAVNELYRVADDVYVAHLPASALSARLLSEANAYIYSAPPTTSFVRYAYHSDGIERVVRPKFRV